MSLPPEDQLLARVRARSDQMRLRRLGLVGGGALAVALALVLALVPSTSPLGRPPAGGQPHGATGAVRVVHGPDGSVELTAASLGAPPQVSAAVERRAVRDEQEFSLRLLRRVLAGSGASGNVVLSPSSLEAALVMLDLGARSSTAAGIARTLAAGGWTGRRLAAAWSAVSARLAADTVGGGQPGAGVRVPELDQANGTWAQSGFPVRTAYLRALGADFRTGLWRVDFAHHLDSAVAALDAWTSQHTNGLIPQLFSPGALDRWTRLVLANAVYFAAHWRHGFEPGLFGHQFTTGTGQSETVPFMTTQDPQNGAPSALRLASRVTAGSVTVRLPYVGGRLSALVVMPTHETLGAFLGGVGRSGLAALGRGLVSRPTVLRMPTFSLRTDNALNPVLSSLGMGGAFLSSADLSGISPVSLYVQAVEQHDVLRVTPQGTVASAGTGVGVGLSSAVAGSVPRITIDRPFLFLVRDDRTGTVLFEAAVQQP